MPITNLIPVAQKSNVPQLETTTQALGGPDGPMNHQAQALLNRTEDLYALESAHRNNFNNPHQTTKYQVGLGNVDNTSDMDKPASTAVLAALGGITRESLGVDNVDNTSDANKPVSNATQAALDGKMGINIVVEDKITSAYTLALADGGKYLRFDDAVSVSVSVPATSDVAFPIGTLIRAIQSSDGDVSFIPSSGVTINTPESLTLLKKWSNATLIKVGSDTWDLHGDLRAPDPWSIWVINLGINTPVFVGGCLTNWSPYGYVALSPAPSIAGQRPSALLISGTDLSGLTGYIDGNITVTDSYANTIGYVETNGMTGPITVPITYQGVGEFYDIVDVTMNVDTGGSIAICSVTLVP